MAEDHVGFLENEEIHELRSTPGSKTAIIDTFGFEIELDSDRVHLGPLNEWDISFRSVDRDRLVFELEEPTHEVQSVLVNMQA